MSAWIYVTDRLPNDCQLVLIETTEDNVFYYDEKGRERLWQHYVARFELIEPWSNNPVPFQWSHPPGRTFGQNVRRWMPIPK